MKYSESIPLKPMYIQMIIDSIEYGEFLYRDYTEEKNFPTDCGSEGQVWNHINKCIVDKLPADHFQIIVMNRGRWKFLGIYDKETHYLYTLMREKNLNGIRKKVNEHLFHYVNALSKLNDCLEDGYSTEYEQLSFLPENIYDDHGNEILEKILESMIKRVDSHIERYVLIAFDSIKGHIKDIKGIVAAKGLDYYKEEDWNEYIIPQYNSQAVTEQEITNDEYPIMLRRRVEEEVENEPDLTRKVKKENLDKKNKSE